MLALAMLALMLLPAEVWKAPVDDQTYKGFDANLMYISTAGGTVNASADSLDLTAPPAAYPTVNLATTALRRVQSSVAVTIVRGSSSAPPLRIGVWSPVTDTGYFIDFGPSPANLLTADAIAGGVPGAILTGGDLLSSSSLGDYVTGMSYSVSLDVDRTVGRITARISGNGADRIASIDSHAFPALFRNVPMSLGVSSTGGDGESRLLMRDFVLTLPHERSWASRVEDPVVSILVVALSGLGALAIAAVAIRAWRRKTAMSRSWRVPRFRLLIAAVAVYLVGNVVLFPLGSHPFDFKSEELYAYIAGTYGPAHLYYPANVAALASVWGGIPHIELAFPYGPVVAYMFTGIGWIGGLLGIGAAGLSGLQLVYLIKSVNVLFGLGDAVLIYMIARATKTGERWSLIAGGFFLFNPAVWFSMSVWGQTHVISIFFVLAAIWFAERRAPLWAWIALTTALLTRPQMVVFGLLLGIVFLRKFPLVVNLRALAWTVIALFIALAPLSLAVSPSLPIDVMVHNLYVQEAGGNQASLTTVSQSAYSVWPLVTYLVHGTSGVERAYTPSSAILAGSLTYQNVSQAVTILAMLAVSGALLVRKRSTFDAGGYLPLIAVGVAAFLLLLTGIVATHFLLALPLFLLCRRWMGTTAYLYVAMIWTVGTFVPMYGDMGLTLSSQQYPLLAASNSGITRFFVALYSWDRFITLGVVANICAVVWLAFYARPFGAAPLAPAGKPA